MLYINGFVMMSFCKLMKSFFHISNLFSNYCPKTEKYSNERGVNIDESLEDILTSRSIHFVYGIIFPPEDEII